MFFATRLLFEKRLAASRAYLLPNSRMWCAEPDCDSLAQENDRLRRENRILKEEREVLKKATYYPAGDYEVICREGITQIAGRNIARMTIRKSYASMGSRCR